MPRLTRRARQPLPATAAGGQHIRAFVAATIAATICVTAGATAVASSGKRAVARGPADRWSAAALGGPPAFMLHRDPALSGPFGPGGLSVPSGPSHTRVAVGGNPTGIVVNPRTHTVYVANGTDGTISVIDSATCNDFRAGGCRQAPPTISAAGLFAVDTVTDTIYAANGNDNTVSVVDGATCNGAVHSGCGQTPATITVGNAPLGAAVDQQAHTLYVESLDGTVSFVDTRACNAGHTSGCGQTPPTTTVGDFPFGMTIDQATDDVYVTSRVESDVWVLDGHACNADHSNGCRPTTIPARMGGFGSDPVIDQAAHTVYVPNNGDGNVSFFRLAH